MSTRNNAGVATAMSGLLALAAGILAGIWLGDVRWAITGLVAAVVLVLVGAMIAGSGRTR